MVVYTLADWHLDSVLGRGIAATSSDELAAVGLQLDRLIPDAKRAWRNIMPACCLIRFHQWFLGPGRGK